MPPTAHRRMESGDHIGKIVLTLGEGLDESEKGSAV
jgi:hypothetical protein